MLGTVWYAVGEPFAYSVHFLDSFRGGEHACLSARSGSALRRHGRIEVAMFAKTLRRCIECVERRKEREMRRETASSWPSFSGPLSVGPCTLSLHHLDRPTKIVDL